MESETSEKVPNLLKSNSNNETEQFEEEKKILDIDRNKTFINIEFLY